MVTGGNLLPPEDIRFKKDSIYLSISCPPLPTVISEIALYRVVNLTKVNCIRPTNFFFRKTWAPHVEDQMTVSRNSWKPYVIHTTSYNI